MLDDIYYLVLSLRLFRWTFVRRLGNVAAQELSKVGILGSEKVWCYVPHKYLPMYSLIPYQSNV